MLYSVALSLQLIINFVRPQTISAGNQGEEGSFIQGSYLNEYGTRDYKLYIPEDYNGESVPLIIMLHGCGQNPDDFAAGTKMNQIADRETFLVIYPDQSLEANTDQCWNWFDPDHQRRGKGEPSIIAGMTKQISNSYNVHSKQIYVAGMSAGGARI